MRVSKAQVQLNRAHIVETASKLFRERGYDGVGVADLMAAAGFTHGGFYKHFGSKADLMAQAAASGFSQSLTNSVGLGATAFFDLYVSREHRDARSLGCTMAALCGDAARQSEEVKTTFAQGIENALAALERGDAEQDETSRHTRREEMINRLAHAVGAVVLSRACPDDSPLADEILDVCRREMLAALTS
ncbi:TetR/AcrR family transcriptional regulator [Pseudomonas costantinii]|uniref:TetR family transcriptional regulator n=1 Tax=Pseudomonas costantinii TaxID=168469 RepID=A0A1S2UHY8_9PSED|nr:TetR/AcrR family transcriptional regulator [Pseudomonas costantinii]NVZ21531.1 TetR/AcrR family transcriptional regulator [Pseudomonas costantinii]OIN45923.1 TetR family transcriptional regulator [Pseudomonas costantinii]SEE55130.1 transcriptional regulator, TetR family [Pseudomonas costantinii]